MSDMTTAFAPIVKSYRNDEGDLVVIGKATGPDLDLDEQICDPAWLAKAMPTWMSSGGNIREQHSSIAAGVATDLEQQGDSWMVTATVVDPVSARKVEKGVLKGFSIGIRNAQIIRDKGARGGRIVGGSVIETSLVDRPANPTCKLTLAKAAKPGMSVPAGDLDRDRMLVKVEELTEMVPEPAPLTLKVEGAADSAVGSMMAKLVRDGHLAIKHRGVVPDPAPEPDPVSAELAEMRKSIDALVSALTPTKEAPVADTTDATTEGADDKTTTAPDATKSADSGTQNTQDITALVEAAVAKALAPIRAELAKAMEQPVAGGPARAGTQQDIQKSAARDQELAQAAHYDRLAAELRTTDPGTSRAYKAAAAQLRTTS